jgi:Fic family protein
VNLEALRRSPIGRLVPISGPDGRGGRYDHFAYVPAPLAAEPPLTLRALNAGAKAAMAVVRLDEALSQLPNPKLLVRPFVRREAVSTSALEGTYADFEEVLEAEFLEDRQMSSEQREAYNYVRATDEGAQYLASRPISRRLTGRLQATIVRGTSGETYDAGDLRQRQVKVGARDQPVEEARYIPPPPGDVLVEGFSDWEKWVNTESDLPLVAKIAISHYQFEALHPYNDGNGRVGRLVAILQMIQEGVLRHPVLNIAPWLELRRDRYIDELYQVSVTGDFNSWVEFFCEAIQSQAENGVLTIRELLSIRDEMVQTLRAASIRGAALEVVENLIGYPYIDVPTARRLVGKSFEAANHAIARLVDLGILREITGKKTNRLFMCQKVWRVTSAIGRPRVHEPGAV